MKNLTPGQKKEIFNSIKQADYRWLLLSGFFGIISHIARTLRWKIMMEPLGYKLEFINVFLSILVGYFANLALPRLGEVSRCGVLKKYEKIPFNKAFGTVITERAFDIFSFIILFFINFALQFNKLHTYTHEKIYLRLSNKLSDPGVGNFHVYLILGIIVLILLLFFLFRKKISKTKSYIKFKNLLLGFWEGIRSLSKIKKPVWFILLTLIIWFLYLLMTYTCFRSLDQTAALGIDAGFTVLIFGSIGNMIVQGGIGIYPAIVAETLYVYNVPETTGYAMGWLLWSAQTFMLIFAGCLSLILLPILNTKNRKLT